ncbi:MAG: hypothetical protein Q8868_03580 [Bacteroidota bacterium]|nr:hypothetical protein [Bacteroidota bacterium]
MKTAKYCLILLTIVFCAGNSDGQVVLSGFDSVAFSLPGINRVSYQFFDNGNMKIQYRDAKTELVNYKSNPRWRDAGNGILTAITGFGFTTSTDVNWKISGTIECNDSLPDWTLNLFCPGNVRKERERVKNDDGSWSVEHNVFNEFYWDKDANGVLIENNDTIGFFSIVLNPRENEFFKSFPDEVFTHRDTTGKKKFRISVSWKPSPGIDFGIIGTIHGKNFVQIGDGTRRKLWIYSGDMLGGMLQMDINSLGIAKKYRIQPYMLINRDLTAQNRNELIRLAVVGRILNLSVGNN